MKVPKTITKAWIIKNLYNRSGKFWNMEWSLPTGCIFKDTGLSIFSAIGWAHAFKNKLKGSGHKVEVYGYLADDNRGCVMPQGYDGMDFCIVDDHLIVNLWLAEIEPVFTDFAVLNINDKDPRLGFYGDKYAWVKEKE